MRRVALFFWTFSTAAILTTGCPPLVEAKPCAEDKDCPDPTKVCFNGECVGQYSCNPSCGNGTYCTPDGCAVCNVNQHCGDACLDCTGQKTGHTCIDRSCGCRTTNDCGTGNTCLNGTCAVCTPDCEGKCGGAPDGCQSACTQACPPGQRCDNMTCVPCNLAELCGKDGEQCINCTDLSNNRACVNRNCGCRDRNDCAAGVACNNNACDTTCVPNCQGLCGGASDGCVGTCTADCSLGSICDRGQCTACTNTDPNHCGTSCLNCAGQATNKDCIGGACGCNDAVDCNEVELCYNGTCCTPSCTGKCGGASDGCGGTCNSCLSGRWCDGQVCMACTDSDPSHCGAGCLNCAGQTGNKDCISGVCGCNDAGDCGFCEKCSGSACVYQTDAEDLKNECENINLDPCQTGSCSGAGTCGIFEPGTPCGDCMECNTVGFCENRNCGPGCCCRDDLCYCPCY